MADKVSAILPFGPRRGRLPRPFGVSGAVYEFLNSRLTIGARFGLIAICFAAPIVLLLFLYIGQVWKDVGFVQKELEGTRYLERIWPQFAAAAADSGAAARPAGWLDARDRTFNSESAAKAFAEAGPDTKLDAGIALIGAVADGSNLTLDTDLDSFYAMDAATVALPRLMAASASLAQAADARDRDIALKQVQIYAAAAQSSLNLAMRNDPSGRAREALAVPARALANAAGAVQSVADASSGGAARLGSASLQATIDTVWKADSAELARMLQAKLDGYLDRLVVNLGLVALAMAAAALLISATTRGLTGRLNDLLKTMDRLVARDATVEVPHQGDLHETGRIAATLAAFKQGLVEAADLIKTNQAQQALVSEERSRAEAAKFAAIEHQHWAEMAGEIAGVGLWRRDTESGRGSWSKQMFRICGLDPAGDVPELGQAIDVFHPDDRATMTAEMEGALRDGRAFARDVRIVRPNGEVRYVISRGSAEKGSDGRVSAAFGVFMDVTDAKRAEQALRESEERYRLLTDRVSDIIIRYDRQGVIEFASPAISQLGYIPEEVIGRATAEFTHPDDLDRVGQRRSDLISDRPLGDEVGTAFRLRRADGEWVWMQGNPATIHDEAGDVIGVVTVLRDVTFRVAAEERQRLMVHELNHRVKNTLVTVQSIAVQTERSTDSPAAFAEAFNARVVALSHSHDLLTQNAWSGACLRELVSEHLEPHQGADGRRFDLRGPDVHISPKAAVALGMALGELTTNAVRHGALSTAEGAVEVSWTLPPQGDGARLSLVWRERGGPPVVRPSRRGFGMRLIERGLNHELGGSARLNFESGGIVCEIEFPLVGSVQ